MVQKNKYGIIYQKGGTSRGVVKFLPSPFFRFLRHFIKASASGLTSFVVLSLLFTFGPIFREEINYSFGLTSNIPAQVGEPVPAASGQTKEEVQKEAEAIGINSHFSLAIPKINASSNIIANVDPFNKPEYLEALKTGVAHAKGSYFPGQEKKIYLFSHSTDSPINIAKYNAVFYLLRKLNKGDKIIVFFADKKYKYEVTEKVVTDPSDISWLTEETSEEILVLQTCDPPGTTWKRLIVIAKPNN